MNPNPELENGLASLPNEWRRDQRKLNARELAGPANSGIAVMTDATIRPLDGPEWLGDDARIFGNKIAPKEILACDRFLAAI